MKIKGKDIVIYSLKVFKNVTFLVAYNTEKEKYAHFEVSSQYNEMDKIIKLFRNPMYFFIGYGSKHYDNIFINYMIKKRDHVNKLGNTYTCHVFYEQLLENIKTHNWDDQMKELKYAQNFDYIDLELMLSSRFASHSIFEQCFRDGVPQSIMTEDDDYVGFDEFNDRVDDLASRCEIIYNLVKRNFEKIDLRIEMFAKYNVDVLDNNDSSILNTILLETYQEKNNVRYNQLIQDTNIIYSNPIRNMVSKDIEFETKEFCDFFEQLKSMLYSNSNSVIRRFVSYDTTNVLFATNGVECENNINIFKSEKSSKVYMLHIESLEASICRKYCMYPNKLTEKYPNTNLFNSAFDEFLACAKNSPEGSNRKKTFSEGLENIISKYNVKNTWLYDPATYGKIKINSNLILMMLIEQLLIYGANIILIEDNTIVFSSFIDLIDIINKWSSKFGLSYSYTELKKFFKYSVFDYVALDSNNKTISHGIFESNDINIPYSNSVLKAVKQNILFNIEVEDTILNCGNVKDFMLFQKLLSPKSFYYRGINIGREVLFYITSNPLPTLYVEEIKSANSNYSRMEALIKGVSICIVENFMLEENTNAKFNIDYTYYVNKAKALIQEIKTAQTIIEMT